MTITPESVEEPKKIQELTNEAGELTDRSKEEALLIQQLESARIEYAHAQQKYLAKQKQDTSKINTLLISLGVKSREVSAKDIPKEVTDLKTAYDQAKAVYGKDLLRKKMDELATEGKYGSDYEEAIALFKQTVLKEKLVIEEKESLAQVKPESEEAESLSSKERTVVNKFVDWYINPKTAKWKKVGVSFLVSTAAIGGGIAAAGALGIGGGFAGAGAVTTWAGTRAVRAIAGYVGGEAGSAAAGKAYDKYSHDKEKIQKANEDFETMMRGIKEENFEDMLSQMEEKYDQNLELRVKSVRRKAKIQLAARILVAGTTAMAMSNINSGISLDNSVDTEVKTSSIDTNTVIPPIGDSIPEVSSSGNATEQFMPKLNDTAPPLEQLPSIPEMDHEVVYKEFEITARPGEGAISMMGRAKLEAAELYKDVPFAKQPESIRQLLKYSKEELAKGLEMYRPGETNESMLVLKGDKFEFGKNGSESFVLNRAGQKSDLLTHNYEGAMFDADKGAIAHEAPEPKVAEREWPIDPTIMDDNSDWPVDTEKELPTNDQPNVSAPTMYDWPIDTDNEYPIDDSSVPEVVPSDQHIPPVHEQGTPQGPDGEPIYAPAQESTVPGAGTPGIEATISEGADNAYSPVQNEQVNSIAHTETAENVLTSEAINLMTEKKLDGLLDRSFGRTGIFGQKIPGEQSREWYELTKNSSRYTAQSALNDIKRGNVPSGYRRFAKEMIELRRSTGLEPMPKESTANYIHRLVRHDVMLHPDKEMTAQVKEELSKPVEYDDVYRTSKDR